MVSQKVDNSGGQFFNVRLKSKTNSFIVVTFNIKIGSLCHVYFAFGGDMCMCYSSP